MVSKSRHEIVTFKIYQNIRSIVKKIWYNIKTDCSEIGSNRFELIKKMKLVEFETITNARERYGQVLQSITVKTIDSSFQ